MNEKELTNQPQIHLSATDGKDVEEATQIVFHKMPDGTLFIEWYTRTELNQFLLHDQAIFDKTAFIKLIEFLNDETTY
jgi:hypothetical protein